jgi:hypothetical protein
MEASWGARHPASGWMPLQKLDEVERAERIERQEVERKPESRKFKFYKNPGPRFSPG